MNNKRITSDDKRIKKVIINSPSDIRKAIAPYIKNVKTAKVEVKGDISWEEETPEGKKVKRTETVTAVSEDVNRKEALIAGFNEVKKEKERWDTLHNALIEDAYSVTIPNMNIDDMYMSVDQIVKHRLAGKREGLTIIWILGNKKYIFDPYTSELKEEDVVRKNA